MHDQYYCVDEKNVRFVSYRLFEENQVVRIFFDLRNYDIPFAEMPEVMRHWIPRSDGEFITTYDHISAESGLKPTELGIAILPAPNNELIEATNEHISLLQNLSHRMIEGLEVDINDFDYLKEKIKEAIINVKNSPAYIQQAKAIQGLLRLLIDGKTAANDKYLAIQRTISELRKILDREQAKAKKTGN